MKKADLTEIKNLTLDEVSKRAIKLQEELADLVIDKNMNKLKDIKLLGKKRKNLAQILTIARQKELLEGLQSELKKEVKTKKIKKGHDE